MGKGEGLVPKGGKGHKGGTLTSLGPESVRFPASMKEGKRVPIAVMWSIRRTQKRATH